MSLRSRSLEKFCIAVVDLRKCISRDEVTAREKIEIVHHSSGRSNAFSTVGGPWNEESLWKRAGELGVGDVE